MSEEINLVAGIEVKSSSTDEIQKFGLENLYREDFDVIEYINNNFRDETNLINLETFKEHLSNESIKNDETIKKFEGKNEENKNEVLLLTGFR